MKNKVTPQQDTISLTAQQPTPPSDMEILVVQSGSDRPIPQRFVAYTGNGLDGIYFHENTLPYIKPGQFQAIVEFTKEDEDYIDISPKLTLVRKGNVKKMTCIPYQVDTALAAMILIP